MNNFLVDPPGRKRQYILSIGSVVVVGSICFALSGLIGYQVIALILLLTVSLLAISFDILPVLLSATLSAFIWDFFFIPPRFALHVHTTEDSILLAMYFVIALINGVLTFKIRQIEKSVRLKEERANSVKLYNTILDSLSHELRTPIAAIIGAADNLRWNKNLLNEDKDELIEEISKASIRLNQQVENLLNISRLESGHIKPNNDWCDIVELMYEVVRRVEENATRRKINISMNQNMPLCQLDKGMLDQILYNLLNNAAIHTGSTSRIEVSASCHADLLEIIIEDSGEGFRKEDVKKVFHKFSRYNNSGSGGSGLGLSIVKGFTDALGGSVKLSTGNLGGACFVLTFPVKATYFTI